MTHPLHPGARKLYRLFGIVFCFLIVSIPIGVFFLWRATAARVTVGDHEVTASDLFGTRRFALSGVRKIGLFRAPLLARGLALTLAEMRVGGAEAIHLCLQYADGKTKRFMVSKYDHSEQIVAEVSRICRLPVGDVVMKGLGRLEWVA